MMNATLTRPNGLIANINTKYATALPERIIDALRQTKVPWGPVGYVTYKRTYSRHLDDNDEQSPKEEYWQTIVRCLNGILKIGGAFTQMELETLAEYLIGLKCNFSGRALWQLGTKTVEKLGGDSLQACWHVRVNEPIHPFCFTFDELMLGGGVGFSILPQDVYEIPQVKFDISVQRVDSYDCDFIVPDNREGWVELLRKILEGFFFTGKNVRYNPDCLRARGARIKSFGGTASGSHDLVLGIAEIVKILKRRVGDKLTPVDCLDIQNILGMIVVAGNVRRSAEIAKGAPNDREFLLAKYWGDGKIIPKWRQQSNNTVAVTDLKELAPEFWWSYEKTMEDGSACGENYGLYNPDLAANYGRIVDGRQQGINRFVCGPNPCGEIMLESNEACNLGELYLVNLENPTELHTAAELMLKCLKTISKLKFSNSRTDEVVTRNRRLGLGITGVMAAHHLRKPHVLDATYKHLKEVDRHYSKEIGTVESIALTTVKPSGTAAKLPNACTPGANPAFSQFVSLQIQFAADSPMLQKIKDNGYPMEPKLNIDNSRDFNVQVVSFPVAYPDGTPDESMSAIEQLENVAMLQRFWSDNAVSSTIQYRPEEVPAIKDWLSSNYSGSLKTVAFSRQFGHGFPQAPNRVLTRDQYLEFASRVKPLDSFDVGGDMDDTPIDGIECIGDRCGIK
jgi:ribonucleoside-triphosphate reductase (thioredoxin)